ncbi:hypothetical protein LIER_23449 [Lithospermum erythrorhizon]|uniref:NAC domain-containing protein n=1 Tax=Lithospermum erythrorhizon TaxID=34254 RepID=A0AAV3R366_LITER
MAACDGKQVLDLPSGYCFNPTDYESIHYLKQKVLGRELPADIIPAINLYTCHPQDIPYENNMRINNLAIREHIIYEFNVEEAAFEPQDLNDNVKQKMEQFVLCKVCIMETVEGIISEELN